MTEAEETHSGQRASREWWLIALLVAAVLLCFGRALTCGFVYDDRVNVIGNYKFRGLTADHLRWMFTTFFPGHYQPLTWVTLGLDYTLWGLDPFGYHLVNVVLHAANAVLFYFVIKALLGRAGAVQAHLRPDGGGACEPEDPTAPGPAAPSAPGPDAPPRALQLCCLAGALFFALHPLRVESVAWVTERRDVLSGFFLLASVLAYLRRRDGSAGRGWGWYAVALLLFALSLLSKAWGITLPVVLLLLDVYPLRRLALPGAGAPAAPEAPSRRLVLGEKIPFFLLALAFAVLAFLAQKKHAMPMVVDHGFVDRVVQSAYGLCFYPMKTLAPVRLVPLYMLRPDFDPFEARYVVCALIAVGVTVWLAIMRRRWPWALSAWCCYAVIVSPVLGLAQSGPQIAADRYTYLACLPFAVLLAGGLLRIAVARREGGWSPALSRAAFIAVAGWLVLLSALTRRQLGVWRDEVALWAHTIACDPSHYEAYYNRGCALEEEGDFNGALADYEAAIELDQAYPKPYNNRGIIRERRGDAKGALADYNTAIRLAPEYAKPYNNRAVLRKSQGDLRGALEDYNTALRHNPNYGDAYNNRGSLHRSQGEYALALADYAEALRCSPESYEIHFNRGNTRRDQGDRKGALEDYATAIRLQPDDPRAYNNRGNARRVLGDAAGALADFSAAIQADPEYAKAYLNRAALHRAQGDLAAALTDYDAAIRLDPSVAKAHLNRGRVRETQGDLRGALEDLNAALRLDPRYALAYSVRAHLRSRLRDTPGAIADYSACVGLVPGDAQAYNNRGSLRQQAGDAAGALADYSAAIRADPKLALAYNNRANIRKDRRDLQGALDDYNTALRLKPDFPAVHVNRGELLLRAGNPAAAARDFGKALELAPVGWPHRAQAERLLARARAGLASRAGAGALEHRLP